MYALWLEFCILLLVVDNTGCKVGDIGTGYFLFGVKLSSLLVTPFLENNSDSSQTKIFIFSLFDFFTSCWKTKFVYRDYLFSFVRFLVI